METPLNKNEQIDRHDGCKFGVILNSSPDHAISERQLWIDSVDEDSSRSDPYEFSKLDSAEQQGVLK